MAGSQTSSLLTQSILGHFATSPDSLKKAREEFDNAVTSGPAFVVVAGECKAAFMKKNCSHTLVSELDYLNLVMKESLRLRPPIV